MARPGRRAEGGGLQALLFRDTKGSWGDDDARQYDESTPPDAWKVEHAEVTESGPLCSALFVRLAGERSWLELTLRLAAGRDAIDCEARLLWNERGARLKLSVPCGAAARPTHTTPARRWPRWTGSAGILPAEPSGGCGLRPR